MQLFRGHELGGVIHLQSSEIDFDTKNTDLYAVRAIERVPAGSCHFPCSTNPSQSVVSFPCIQK